jgi:glyoxalase-like protein
VTASGILTGVPELDHVIVFLDGPDACDGLDEVAAAGLVVEPGVRHVGQGTRNRRILFPDRYVELLWVDAPDEAATSGLRFAERCRGGGRPLGVVLRGRLADPTGFLDYVVPAGPALRVLDDPAAAFLAVHETDDPAALRPVRRLPGEHVNAVALAHVEVSGAAAPVNLDVPGLSFAAGEPALTLHLAGREAPIRLRPRPR